MIKIRVQEIPHWLKKKKIYTLQQLVTLPLILCKSLLCRVFHDFLDQA